MSQSEKKAEKSSTTRRIVFGIGLGLAVGLFFGDKVAWLQAIGDGYVGLLQMTVLPFVVVSLIANTGRFSIAEGRALAKTGSLVLLLLFAVSLLALLVLPLSFPKLESGAFFSSGLIETRDPPDFFELYIPSNPFYSLSANLVPAVVVFSILFGVALAGLDDKKRVLSLLDVVSSGLGRVNAMVVKLTPIGVFAIAGAAAGTMTLSEFGRLQAYLATHTLGVLLLTFLVVPMLVSVLTPISYGKVLRASRDFLLTAWAIGSLFAVLPMLIKALEDLLEDEDWVSGESHSTPAVLVPLAYPFPTVGKLLALVFVPFVAWFLGTPMDLERYPLFLSAGLFSSFGSLVVTIPFLLQLMQLPSDFFNLFLMAGVWSARLGDLAGGMHLLAFTLLTIAGLSGRLKLQPRKALAGGIAVAVATLAIVGGTRLVLAQTFPGKYARTDAMENLHVLSGKERATVLATAEPNPHPLGEDQSRLGRAVERGVMRVGFAARRLPFSFHNAKGHLVGFDIDLLGELATDMGVDLQFVPYEVESLAEQLSADHFDFAIGGLWGTIELANEVLFTDPYIVAHGALLVLDHDRKHLDSIEELQALGGELSLGIARSSFLTGRALQRFPDAELVTLDAEADFFETTELDGLVTTAEGGSAWTLAYPHYGVVLPLHPSPRIPLVFAVAGRDRALTDFLNVWIGFQRTQGTIDQYFDYWIKGGGLEDAEPRWSIGGNVLGLW